MLVHLMLAGALKAFKPAGWEINLEANTHQVYERGAMFITLHDMYGKEVHVVVSKVKTIQEFVYGLSQTHCTKITFVDENDMTVSENVSVVRKLMEESSRKK
jgi:DNA polymerase III delta prime subunit